MTVQFIDISGQRMAILPVADYERLMEIAEDRADEAAADAAERRRVAGEEYIPAEMVDRMIAGESPLKVWREYRGLTQTELGKTVGLNKMTISGIESGRRDTNSRNWRRLADALSVDVDDILPDEISD